MAKRTKIEWGTKDWAKKLKQQAEDSREYRHKLYDRVDLKNKKKILDVGCGTGAITKDIAEYTTGEVIGIDNEPEKLTLAKKLVADMANVKLLEANVLELPFDDLTFDLVIFNIVLVYIKSQQLAVNEMTRVTKDGGIVLATLEPDYAGRIDYPECSYVPLFLESLEKLGADLYTGRKLKLLFNSAGLKTEVGMDTESEFTFPKDDNKRLERYLQEFWVFEKLYIKAGWSKDKINKAKGEEIERIKKGLGFSYQPCFYAIGKKYKT